MNDKDKQQAVAIQKLDKIANILEQLLAVQMYSNGAKQQEIADNLGMSIGKVNKLIKGVRPNKTNNNE